MLELLALSLAYVVSMFYRALVSVIAPELTADLSLDESQLGLVASAFFVAFAAAQVPVGMSLDRLGPRRTVSLFLLIAVVGATAFALAPGFSLAAVGMCLIGVGCAPVFTGSMVVVARRYPPQKFGFITAMLIVVGGIGDLLSTTPLAVGTAVLGWRGAIGVAIGLTLVSAIACYLLVEPDPDRPDHQPESAWQLFTGMVSMISVRPLWAILPLFFTGYAVVMAIRGLWSGPYLHDVFQLDPTARGNVLFAMSVALGISTFAYGIVDRKFGNPKRTVAIGSTVVTLAILLIAVLDPRDWTVAAGLLVLMGLFGVTYPILMAHGRSFIPTDKTGRGVSFLTLVAFLGVGVIQALSGWVVETAQASGGSVEGAYVVLFAWLAATLGASVLIYLVSPPAGRGHAVRAEAG